LSPNFSSHDWHVQPSCQRPKTACPPERSVFQSKANPSDAAPEGTPGGLLCPRNPFKLTILPEACQFNGPTGFPHPRAPDQALGSIRAAFSRQNRALPPAQATKSLNNKQLASERARTEASIHKKIVWRFLRTAGPLCPAQLKPFEELCPRIRSLVAEADSGSDLPSVPVRHYLMPGPLKKTQAWRPHLLCSERSYVYTTGESTVQEFSDSFVTLSRTRTDRKRNRTRHERASKAERHD
jgi:hypothetical protein